MPRLLSLSLLTVLLALAPVPGSAQSGNRLWGGLGAALGTPGIGVVFDGSLLRAETLWQARLAVHAPFMSADYRDPFLTEAAVMVGRGGRTLGNWGSVAAGLAVVSGERSSEDTFETVGLAGEARLISQRFPRIGVALGTNLNSEASFAALTLSLQLGRVP